MNRDFMHRASRSLAERGIRQFLDIGTGIPTRPNLHQVVQGINPSARVVYGDNDPIVLRHAEALLHSTPEGSTTYIQADVREPERSSRRPGTSWTSGSRSRSPWWPSCTWSPTRTTPTHRRRTPRLPVPGSYLALSHATGDFDPETWQRVVEVYRQGGTTAQVRSRDEFASFFTGLELVEPGIALAADWHPEPGGQPGGTDRIPLYVGVARKP